MKKFLFAALPLSAIFAAGFFMLQPTAQAQHDAHDHDSKEKPVMAYTCAADGFTLTQNGDQYTLQGRIETPTPGFAHELQQTEDKNGRIKATLKLTAPEGMVVQVLDGIDINHTFEHDGMLHMLSIKVDADFNWAPAAFNCTHN